uniref:Carboxylic ester hydrolase n=1 Tax=Acrobeloides nanus TaxID=290746 RepID=A0A914E741_9BILA
MTLKILIVLFLLEPFVISQSDPITIRKISSGYIRGRKHISENGNEGYVFLGIPYAKPPIGELRFRKPEKSRPWLGVMNTTEYRASCYWNSTATSNFASMFNMSEDCLHVNIYTNKECLTKGGCAVIHYFHGGRFIHGTPTQFNHSFLVDNFASRDVIFVSVGVRNAAFGVLNLNHKLNLSQDINSGFQDVVASLQWTQSEISKFGGNKNKVTIMGHSGGGINVNLLLVSPLTRGLFHQAVIMSGIMGLNVFPLVQDRNEGASRYLAYALGCARTLNKESYDSKFLIKDAVYVDQELLLWYCEQIFITIGYNYTNETIDVCAKEYNSSSRAIDLADNIRYYVPHFNLAERIFQSQQPVYLYQFEYSGIGDAFVSGPNIPQYVPEEIPHHAQEMVLFIF